MHVYRHGGTQYTQPLGLKTVRLSPGCLPPTSSAATFAALADPTRRAILARLVDGEATVNELAAPFPISAQAVGKHLRVLERAGSDRTPAHRAAAARRGCARWRSKDAAEWFDTTARSGRLALIAWTSGCETMAERAPFGTGGFTTTRIFAAPRERVWREWTEPERFADWFGGLECEIPLSTVSMDVRPGGAWRATMFCGPAAARSAGRASTTRSPHPGGSSSRSPTSPATTAPSSSPSSSPTSATAAPRCASSSAGTSAQASSTRRGKGWGHFFDRIAQRLAA